MNRLILSILTVTIIVSNSTAKSIDNSEIKDRCLRINNEWIAEFLELIKNTPGYSAPVAARTTCYLTLNMYESILPIMSNNISLKGQLNDFTYDLNGIDLEQVNYEHVCNYTAMKLAVYYFANMPPRNAFLVEEKYQNILKGYKNKVSKRKRVISEMYCDRILNAVIKWSEIDGAIDAWKKNFPEDYKSDECEGCWVKTYPGYISALQPYWGQNRISITNNREICNDIPFLKFSKDSLSTFYIEAKQLNDVSQKFLPENIVIAKYWNDAPGLSGTPIGHVFQMAQNLLINNRSSIEKSMELYVTLGVALNDAVIECWRLKYEFNLIRPITYIQRYISKDFSTSISTPPFPEFPSGHSFQAGCGTEIFKYFFSDTIPFTDNTNANRFDIDGHPRTFNSFTEMSEEMSMSRYYGGIHFMNTLNVSLIYGRKFGENTINKLNFHKF